jgi:hypothetical protein
MLGNFNTGDIATRLVWDLIDALGLRGIQLTSAGIAAMVWGFHSLAHRLNVAKWETEKEEKKG